MCGEQLAEGRVRVRHRAREHAVQHDPERVHVRARVDGGGVAELLGRHVGRGSHERAGARGGSEVQRGSELGHPEVEDLRHAAVGHEHVRGFEIAVHDPERVRGREPSRDASAEREHVDDRERALCGDPRFEVVSREQLVHHEGRSIGRATHVERRDHVRMIERRHRARLVLEAPSHFRALCVLRVEHLERHASTEQLVLRLVDHAHAARAETATDAVATAEQRADVRIAIRRAATLAREHTEHLPCVRASIEERLDLGARDVVELTPNEGPQPIDVERLFRHELVPARIHAKARLATRACPAASGALTRGSCCPRA